jgi:PEP-CTERM motif
MAQFNFNTSFAIESGGPSAEYGGTSITSVGNTVFGVEGNGVIQFNGAVTSISWTNPVFENWYGFTLGVPVAAVPEPETYALMLAGLAALGAVTRRRRKA